MELLSNPTFLQVIVVVLTVFSVASVVMKSASSRQRELLRQCESLQLLLRESIKLLKKEMAKPRPTMGPSVVREVLPVGPIEEEALTQEQMEAIFSTSDTASTEEKIDDQ